MTTLRIYFEAPSRRLDLWAPVWFGRFGEQWLFGRGRRVVFASVSRGSVLRMFREAALLPKRP